MFVQNLVGPLKYNLQFHYCTSFTNLVEKGFQLEKALITQGKLKYPSKNTNMNTTNDKNKYWAKNKHVTNDGVVNAKTVNKIGPTITLRDLNHKILPHLSQHLPKIPFKATKTKVNK